MSSTNRWSVREASDYYSTPHNVISDALGKFFELEYVDSVKDVLDPCAGGNVEKENTKKDFNKSGLKLFKVQGFRYYQAYVVAKSMGEAERVYLKKCDEMKWVNDVNYIELVSDQIILND